LAEQSGTITGVKAFELPNCSKKSDNEISGGVVTKVMSPNTRATAISQSFSKTINTTSSLYITKDKKPFCKLR
jgi:hypothetical protein